MSRGSIRYTSDVLEVSRDTNVLDTEEISGIRCVWSGKLNNSLQIVFTWKFDWEELQTEGVYEITGHITVSSNLNWFPTTIINVRLTENDQVIKTQVLQAQKLLYDYACYEYYFSLRYAPVLEKPDYNKMFAPSDQNDTILIVDGKKLHVNKAFLSYHSEFFRALFSSNYKEGQMDEIPIEDVSYEDFAFILSTFYPNPVFPNDKNVEKLLEMGRRFLVSSAISITEYHLMNVSKIKNEKKLLLADEYEMSNLVEKCIREVNTAEKAKNLKQSSEFEKLSDKVKFKILDRIMELI